MSPGHLSRYAFVLCTDGTPTLRRSRLQLVGGDGHTAPGTPVDLVDMSAVPLRYALGFDGADEGRGW